MSPAKIITKHTAPVTSCALNSDETTLVTVSRDTVSSRWYCDKKTAFSFLPGLHTEQQPYNMRTRSISYHFVCLPAGDDVLGSRRNVFIAQSCHFRLSSRLGHLCRVGQHSKEQFHCKISFIATVCSMKIIIFV